MSYRLPDNLSFCACGDRVILLDLAGDRYFCLGSGLELAFKRWAAGEDIEQSESDIDLLRERGLLVEAEDGPTPVLDPPLPRASRDLLDEQPSASWRGRASALAAELSASIRLRRRPLRETIGRCRTNHRKPALAGDQIVAAAKAIAAALERNALLLGSADRCLARAVAAMDLCHAHRLYPSLVLGVRINPFAAHAWVQIGDRVLVGDYDQVRLFTPILVVQ